VYVAAAELPGALAGGLVPRRIGAELGPVDGRPRWSPDGSEIAFAVFTTSDEFGGSMIHAIKPDGSGSRPVVDGHNPDWSPDGETLSFARTVDPSEYWNDRPCTVRIGTVGAAGTGERLLDPLGDGCDFPAQFSPDGTQLAALLIASTPEEPELAFHLGFVPVDGATAPVIVQDSQGGSWQPVAAPLPPAPSFPTGSASR
jgi:Tol biopolymer transport system component